MDTRPHPGQIHQCTTDALDHDGCVSQGLTNGYIVIKGHEDKHQDLHAAKEVTCKDLCHAFIVGDDFLLRYRKSTINLGAVVVDKQASAKDKQKRKKYMGSNVSDYILCSSQ